MIKLAAVTYTRVNECLTEELIYIGNKLNELDYEFTMEWYCEQKSIVPDNVNFKIRQNLISGTKYVKLIHLLSNRDYDYLLSLDNDIDANIQGLINLVNSTIDNKKDLSWGRIESRKVNNLVSNLVRVDKLLSHNVLRPLLWKFNIGVTIPGQCFMLNVNSFKGKLPETDTFLDDLSIGIFAAKNKYSYLYSKGIVAREIPSYSFKELYKQRSRWALGFKQVLSCLSLNSKDKKLLYIHAFSYHILPLLHLFFLCYLLVSSPAFFITILLFVAFIISSKDHSSFGYALIYQLVFPVFHIRWLQKFLEAQHAT